MAVSNRADKKFSGGDRRDLPVDGTPFWIRPALESSHGTTANSTVLLKRINKLKAEKTTCSV
jgi:hypothetical protein